MRFVPMKPQCLWDARTHSDSEASQYCGFQRCCERVKEMMAIIYCTFLSSSVPDSGCAEFCKRSGVMAPE